PAPPIPARPLVMKGLGSKGPTRWAGLLGRTRGARHLVTAPSRCQTPRYGPVEVPDTSLRPRRGARHLVTAPSRCQTPRYGPVEVPDTSLRAPVAVPDTSLRPRPGARRLVTAPSRCQTPR